MKLLLQKKYIFIFTTLLQLRSITILAMHQSESNFCRQFIAEYPDFKNVGQALNTIKTTIRNYYQNTNKSSLLIKKFYQYRIDEFKKLENNTCTDLNERLYKYSGFIGPETNYNQFDIYGPLIIFRNFCEQYKDENCEKKLIKVFFDQLKIFKNKKTKQPSQNNFFEFV